MRLRRPSATLAVLASASVVGGCASGLASRAAPRASSPGDAPPPGVELPVGPRVDHPGVAEPDPRLTPGAVFPNTTVAEICRSGYARQERDVSISMKIQVFRAYRVRYVPGRFTVDHLVPLELGGANVGRDARTGRVVVTANLWPQPNFGQATAAVKDRLENYLHDELCAGRIGLREAQLEIAHDWYGSWVQAGRP
jgi:hypothetical protein